MIEPTTNDVLSGRGASFNRHEGNEQFRKLLAQKRVVYSKSDKMRKVAISKSIVEAVYSLNPPGRFLRKNAVSDQWEELSKKEALNKVAQAMAYAVRDLLKTEKEDAPQRSRSHSSSQIISTTPTSIAAIGGNDAESQQGRINALDEESHTHRPGNQPEQLLLLSQQSCATNQPTLQISTQSNPPASLTRLRFLNQLQTQQQQYLHQQLQMQQLTSLLYPSTSNNLYSTQNSLLSNLPESLPSNDVLRLASSSLLDGSHSLGSIQPSNTLNMQPLLSNDQILMSLSLLRGIPPSQRSDTFDMEILPRLGRPNQSQGRFDMPIMYQNQLLASSGQNQWHHQQPPRPLDLLLISRQLQMVQSGNSHNLTDLRPLVSQTTNSSSTLTSSSAGVSSSSPASRPTSTASLLFEGRKEGCDEDDDEED